MKTYVDVTDTFRSGRKTGVQRVVRELARSLSAVPGVEFLCFDFRRGSYQILSTSDLGSFFRLQDSSMNPPSRETPRGRRNLFFQRSLSASFDVIRRFLIYPVYSLLFRRTAGLDGRTTGSAVILTAEIIGDRARGRWLRRWSRQTGHFLVLVVHDLIPWSHPHLSSLHQTDFRRYLVLLNLAQLLVPVSDTTKGEIERWRAGQSKSKASKIVRLYPGFLPPHEPRGDYVTPGKPLFVSVGTIEARKNQQPLLEVLEGLWSNGFQFSFVFVGSRSPGSEGFEKRYDQLVALGRPILWKVLLSEEELDDLYGHATATLYLSGTEGFGLPVVESLARGVPCIASDRHAVGEVASEYGGCLTVDPTDPETWRLALQEILLHPEKRSELVQSIRKTRFRSWDQYVIDLMEEMNRLFWESNA